jgi:hypothetical protein
MFLKCLSVFLLIGIALPGAGKALAAEAVPEPIRLASWTWEHPEMWLSAAWVDLHDPRVRLRSLPAGEKDPDGPGPWQTTLATVRNAAERNQLDLAVNAHFFAHRSTLQLAGRTVKYPPGSWARVLGWAMTDGNFWSGEPGGAGIAVLKSGKVIIDNFAGLPRDTFQAAGGSHVLVRAGKNVARDDKPAPRTAVGLSADGRWLVLLVVDGRQPGYSVGMSPRQLADEMIRLGCAQALNFDGGGSTTMVARHKKTGKYQLLNRPSDGSDFILPLSIERPVASIFGVSLEEAPRP